MPLHHNVTLSQEILVEGLNHLRFSLSHFLSGCLEFLLLRLVLLIAFRILVWHSCEINALLDLLFDEDFELLGELRLGGS